MRHLLLFGSLKLRLEFDVYRGLIHVHDTLERFDSQLATIILVD